MIILYGIDGNYKDVTHFAQGVVMIPSGNNNCCNLLRGDSLSFILKDIKINEIIYDYYHS